MGSPTRQGREDFIGVVMVNYHTEEEILEKISVLESPCHEIAIVDNSPPSPKLEDYLSHRKKCSYLVSRENVGFAAGVNRGISKLSDSDCYVILNPDIRDLSTKKLDRLTSRVLLTPGLGILAPAIGEGPIQHQHPYLAHLPYLERYEKLPPCRDGHDGLVYRQHVLGPALVLDSEMVDQIGTFEEQFFLYLEEIEYCYRARQAGYDVAFDETVVIEHPSPKTPNDYKVYYDTRNSFLLSELRFSGWARLVYLLRVFIRLYFIVRVDKNLPQIKPWALAVFDGLFGNFGKTRYFDD